MCRKMLRRRPKRHHKYKFIQNNFFRMNKVIGKRPFGCCYYSNYCYSESFRLYISDIHRGKMLMLWMKLFKLISMNNFCHNKFKIMMLILTSVCVCPIQNLKKIFHCFSYKKVSFLKYIKNLLHEKINNECYISLKRLFSSKPSKDM